MLSRSFYLGLALLLTTTAAAQESLFDFLAAGNDTAVVWVEMDYRDLLRNKTEKQYQSATVHVALGEDSWAFPGKVRPRGHARLEVCQHPSLKIKLKKGPLLTAGFSDLNELKLVQPCYDNALGQTYLEREHLVYRLLGVYTEHIHRTVPLRLRLAASAGEETYTRAFLIEEEEQLAYRYGGRIHTGKAASTRALVREAYVSMCLFNYLILNTDWSVFNLHNVEIVTDTSGGGNFVPIPYDFDYSGFVNTRYAVPLEQLEISSILEAKWLGRNVTATEIQAAAAHFLQRSKEARALIHGSRTISPYTRKRWLKRLTEFDKLLRNERKLLRLIK